MIYNCRVGFNIEMVCLLGTVGDVVSCILCKNKFKKTKVPTLYSCNKNKNINYIK